ncbi:uncharacterized protein LOC133912975 [Phragmites australis]|uniref:uncharacterized protein LOC133912975 n=1 Tax=Phragmites australis TaxID=29695 RepID=UPI002D79C754|nr:uncharacterized protein LOC133912975 [Phragmites australis]
MQGSHHAMIVLRRLEQKFDDGMKIIQQVQQTCESTARRSELTHRLLTTFIKDFMVDTQHETANTDKQPALDTFADDKFGLNQNKAHGKKTDNKSSQTKATRKRKKQPAEPHGANRLRSPSKRQHKPIHDKDGDFIYYGKNKPTQPLYMPTSITRFNYINSQHMFKI